MSGSTLYGATEHGGTNGSGIVFALNLAVAAPTIQFTANPTTGGVPLVVQFGCPNIDSASNSIMGGTGGDSLYGGSGNDYLTGYSGNDTLIGKDGTRQSTSGRTTSSRSIRVCGPANKSPSAGAMLIGIVSPSESAALALGMSKKVPRLTPCAMWISTAARWRP